MCNVYEEVSALRNTLDTGTKYFQPVPNADMHTRDNEMKIRHICDEDLTVDPFSLFATRLAMNS